MNMVEITVMIILNNIEFSVMVAKTIIQKFASWTTMTLNVIIFIKLLNSNCADQDWG